MSKIVEAVIGIFVAVFMALLFISIGLSTDTIVSPALVWGGFIGLLVVFAGILGLIK
jgi:hypothetical protein